MSVTVINPFQFVTSSRGKSVAHVLGPVQHEQMRKLEREPAE